MSADKTTRTRWLLFLSATLLVVLSIVFGFYGLRDTLTDRLAFIYFGQGTQLSMQDADQLEHHLKSNPSSFADRIELLAFYSFRMIDKGLTAEEIVNRREHILWVIEHQPASHFAGENAAAFGPSDPDPDGLQQGKRLWLQQVQARPTDSRILYNAARFYFWNGERQQSEELNERAYAIEPQNHDIASSLAELYWIDATHSATTGQVTKMAAKSLNAFQQALTDTHDPHERLYDLPGAAQSAFEAEDYERAASYSKEALGLAQQPDFIDNNADAIHYGNIVLGRIALRHGDIAGASGYLLQATAIKSSPHLETFGPNMMLAKELLDKGESKSVVEYLSLCGKFWKDDDGKLTQWRSTVLAGNTPDFGANLRY